MPARHGIRSNPQCRRDSPVDRIMDMVVFCTVVTIRTGLGNMTAQHPDRNAKVPRRRNLGKAGIAARILAAQQSYAMGLEGRALIRLVELRHCVDEGGVCRPFHPLHIQGPRPEGDVLPLSTWLAAADLRSFFFWK